MVNLDFVRTKPFKEVANSIFVADILSQSACSEVLFEFSNSQQWEVAKIAISQKMESGEYEIVGVVNACKRNAYRILIDKLDNFEKSKTKQHIEYIQKMVVSFTTTEFGLNFSKCGDAEIVRYPVGGIFTAHTDAHKNNAHRAFTVVLYLNDNFTGGETFFPDIDYSCTPKSGRVVIFSPTQLHASMPVLTGEKNIIVFWVFFPGTLKHGEN